MTMFCTIIMIYDVYDGYDGHDDEMMNSRAIR